MLKLFYFLSTRILPMAFLSLSPVFAEGEEGEEYFEEVVEEEAVDPNDVDEVAREPGPAGDMNALRAQVASLTNKVQHLEGQLKKGTPSDGVMPVNGPKAPSKKNSEVDPDVQDLMNEIGATDQKQAQEALGAHTPEEAQAMAKARKVAGKLSKGDMQSDFDTLHKLYAEAMACVISLRNLTKRPTRLKPSAATILSKIMQIHPVAPPCII